MVARAADNGQTSGTMPHKVDEGPWKQHLKGNHGKNGAWEHGEHTLDGASSELIEVLVNGTRSAKFKRYRSGIMVTRDGKFVRIERCTW